jgi:hypothetical protein
LIFSPLGGLCQSGHPPVMKFPGILSSIVLNKNRAWKSPDKLTWLRTINDYNVLQFDLLLNAKQGGYYGLFPYLYCNNI